jgi:hypothetical protein
MPVEVALKAVPMFNGNCCYARVASEVDGSPRQSPYQQSDISAQLKMA